MYQLRIFLRSLTLPARLALAGILFLFGITSLQAQPKPIDFNHDVVPILKAKCASCHTDGTYKGGVSMDTRQTVLKSKALVPGKSGESELIKRITAKDAKERMPPKGEPLTPEQITILRRWIDEGATWQTGFSFTKKAVGVINLKLATVTLPAVQGGRTNPIDRIIDRYLAEKKLPRPEPIDDATFLRRVSLDIVGLLPTVEQLDAFIKDADPDKRPKLIRTLLDDRRAFAEHWLTFWNDLLRNDYAGTGYIDGGRQQITGWLYQSLLDNKPYDQFVRELIHPTKESAGFIAGIKWRGNVNASQVQEVQFAQNITQVFLGINMKCASCHDSFIDGWKLEDAYGLAAITANTPPEIHRCDKPTGQKATASFPFPELGQIDPKGNREQRLQQLAGLMTSKDNGLFSRTIVNRIWQRLMGHGLVEPVDVMSNEPWSADLLDYLAQELINDGYDLKKTIERMVTSQAYQSRCLVLDKDPAGEAYVYRGPIAKRLTAEQYVDALWRITSTAPAKPAFNFPDRGTDPVRAALVVADPLMRSLGRPNREQVVTTRPAELSTLQALDLTNGQALANLVTAGGKKLRAQHKEATPEQLIDGIYRSALSRPPTDRERAIAKKVVGLPMTDDGIADVLWAVFMLPEFQLVR